MPSSNENITNDNYYDQPGNPQETANNHEETRKNNRTFGAKILSQSGYESRHKGIVESSFNKARKKGEKLPGNNNERRNYSYISRIENLVNYYGNDFEKRLWRMSSNKLIIKPESIPDSYWEAQERILRDNGQGHKLSDYEKEVLTDDITKRQKESLESWSNYLGDKNSPYPIWFKVYVWDGMSKMGVFDKEKQQFAKRDKTTVAPYPKLNPAVLAKTYATIIDFYDTEDSRKQHKLSESEERKKDAELAALVKSGNFNKLYSKILLSQKAIPKTPERTEDVRGEWVEYLPGEEQKLANAAEGTPWCVVDPGTGKSYLEYGNYGGYADDDYGYDDDEYSEYDDGEYYNTNKAKFILFHLYDPETNTISESACASIRLDPDGRVAEVSGLNEGQALEDSLIPIVEEKVRSLPGGDEFLGAFADKRELIRLDHKMQNGEELNKDELEFIYEINRPIKTLDTYNEDDPRVSELREKYGVKYALDHGIDANYLVSQLDSEGIAKNLEILVSHKIKIDDLLSRFFSDDIIENLDTLISHGVNIDKLVSRLYFGDVRENLGLLISRGANVDTLISHGAKINDLVSRLGPDDILENLDTLISHGATIGTLISSKVSVYSLGQRLGPDDILENLNTLISHGAKINDLVSRLDPDDIFENLNTLISHGAKINDLVSWLGPDDILENLNTLISHGAKINDLVSQLDSDNVAKNLDVLISHGADIGRLIRQLTPNDVAKNLDVLISHGANIDIDHLAWHLLPDNVAKNLDVLISHGADMNRLILWLTPNDIVENLNTLIAHGANINQVVSRMDEKEIEENKEFLRRHGANI